MLTGSAGSDVFSFKAGDSGKASASSFDCITDFVVDDEIKTVYDSLDFGDTKSVVNDTDVDVDVAAASGNDGKTITASITDGVITLAGADMAKIDSLSEWLAVARVMVDANDEVGAFEFRGSTYVYQENGGSDQDLLVQLLGVKDVSAVSDLLLVIS